MARATRLTAKDWNQKAMAARKHGIDGFQMRGELSLAPEQVDRLTELRDLVKTHEGRLDLRREMVARLTLITDIAFAEMTKWKEDNPDKSLFDSPVAKRASTWFAEARRQLEAFPSDGDVIDITEMLKGGKQ